MILVTLGTQDKSFIRLLEAIQKQIDLSNINDEVVVQAGYTKFKSKDMKIFELIPMEEFDNLIKSCDILITHGGVGSIITGLKNNKKVIAAARLSKYGEHTNDHQLQIIDNFTNAGYILELNDFDKLDEVITKAKSFKPKKFESNTKKMEQLVTNYIDKDSYKTNYFKRVIILIIVIIILIIYIKFK